MKRISKRIASGLFLVCGLAAPASAQWTTSGSNIYYNTGNVGIFTTNPAYHLHVIESSTTDGSRAIYGLANGASGVVNGVYGQTTSTDGRGVIGYASSTSGTCFGVYGTTLSTVGHGVMGLAQATSGVNFGTYGRSNSASGIGVFGGNVDGIAILGSTTATSGATEGVRGENSSTSGIGVVGLAGASSGATSGVFGQSFGTGGVGVQGYTSSTTGGTSGVYGKSSSSSGTGVTGFASATSGDTVGVLGVEASSNAGAFGVYAIGNVGASGTKPFRIDHPQDPTNKYLFHYATESPEVLNAYSGKVILNGAGTATVELPAYFATINTDPRYTLTAVGAPMPLLHIAVEISEADLEGGEKAAPGDAVPTCSFLIAGGVPNGKVSWRVEAVRNDRWVRSRGAPVEVEKDAPARGTYLQPKLYGMPEEMGTFSNRERATAIKLRAQQW